MVIAKKFIFIVAPISVVLQTVSLVANASDDISTTYIANAYLNTPAEKLDGGYNGLFVTTFGGINYLQNQNILVYYANNDSPYGPGQNVTFKWGWNAGGGLGIKLNNWEYSLESSYMVNAANKVNGSKDNRYGISSRAISYLGKVQYDFYIGSPLIPFVNAAIGAITVSSKNNLYSDKTNTGFAYQVGAGVGYQFTQSLRIFTEYEHLATSELSAAGGGNYYYQNNLFRLGATFYIGR